MTLKDVLRQSARNAAVEGLQRVEGLAAQGVARLQPPRAPAEEAPEAEPEPEPAGRYGALWVPQTESDAMAAIANTVDTALFEESGRQEAEWLEPWMDAESTVLDLGCGIGRVARYAAPKCRTLWAVDASEQMLQMARVHLAQQPNVRFAVCRDVEIPDVPSASVDLVYALLVLQHVEREDAFLLLQEIRRVLRPSGRAVLTFPNLLSDIYMDAFLEYVRTRVSSQTSRARMYTPQEVERILPAAGFKADLDVQTEIRVVATPA